MSDIEVEIAKKIAATIAANQDCLVAKFMEKTGLPPDRVQIVYMQDSSSQVAVISVQEKVAEPIEPIYHPPAIAVRSDSYIRSPVPSDNANDYVKGYRAETRTDGTLAVDLLYPRTGDGRPTVLEFGIEEVRAADSIRITYDFDRDGYSILQASGWDLDQSQGDVMDWQEVAFVRAWARVPEVGGDKP